MRKLLFSILLLTVFQVSRAQNITNADSLKRIVLLRQDESAVLSLCYYYAEGNNDSCLKYAQLLHELSLRSHTKHFEGWALFYLSISQAKRGNRADELSLVLQANKMFESLHDSVGISFTNTLLGVIYENYEKDTSKILGFF